MNNRVNTRGIVSTLPGYNSQTTKKKNALWNTNFQTYNPPMAYKILEQDKKGKTSTPEWT